MNRKKGIIKITLNSDLCVSSGYAYAGIIDCDVCYNESGIPYIPGRRLKGCLREAGELIRIDEQELAAIFGSSGSNEAGGIILGNAYPMPVSEYETLNDELTALRKNSSFSPYLTQQKVLEYYTRVKAQTSIDSETGVAKNSSLRYTRVINQYLDGEDEPLSFYAEVEFDCDENTLRRIVKSLRHMGMHRSRGLGNVTCSLEQTEELDVNTVPGTDDVQSDNDYIKLDYVIRNEQPLMLSRGNDSSTEHYISGTSVLGALAGAYLSQDGNTADSEMFQDMFLRGKVIFSNLTPTLQNSESFASYVPAPLFINRLKKTRKLVNLMAADSKKVVDHNADYSPGNGNQPKRLNSQFISFDSKDCRRAVVTEPVVEIAYHHSKKQQSLNGEEGILYSLEVLKEGQFFKGSIYGEKRYIEELVPLLSSNRKLRFGKSKSAQYGACRVVEKKEVIQESVSLKAGERFLIALESEGIFCDESGYSARYETVKKELPKSLNIAVNDSDEADNAEMSVTAGMSATVVNGYHTMWNLKKQSIPAVKAGSYFVYTAASDCEVKRLFAGEKNLEGFGQVGIYKLSGMTYAVEEYEHQASKKEPQESVQLLKAILEKELREYLKEEVWNRAKANERLRCSPSTLGRITLMLKESLAGDKDNAYDNYEKRINSIKRKAEQKEAQRLINSMRPDKLVELCNKENIYKRLSALYETEEDVDNLIKGMWGECMMNLLVYQKYHKSQEKRLQQQ